MKTKVTFIIASALLILACGSSDSTGSGEISSGDATQKAVALVPGTATSTEALDKEEEHRWVVKVRHASGATIEVEIDRASGEVAEIVSETAPFDYDLPAAKPGFLTYAQARAKAFATKAGTLEKWEVKPLESEWELYVRDADTKLWEIKMTADKGDITHLEQKDQAD